MNDIYDIIERTVLKTGQPEEVVEKVIRSMFHDIQEFTSKKKGMNIQIPEVGTFVFRATAIPNFTERSKSIIAHWISRLIIGEAKGLEKTINASKNNIAQLFRNLERVALIKQEYINDHSKYKPRAKAYLQGDIESDVERIHDYVELLKTQLFFQEHNSSPEEDL